MSRPRQILTTTILILLTSFGFANCTLSSLGQGFNVDLGSATSGANETPSGTVTPTPSDSGGASPEPTATPTPAEAKIDLDAQLTTGQNVPTELFGLSTAMGTASHDYGPFADSNFWNLANQYHFPLLRHNWELNTMMSLIFPNRAAVSSPNWTPLDSYLNHGSDFRGFFNPSVDRQVLTLGFPLWLDISSSSDQNLFAQMAVQVVTRFANKAMPVRYVEMTNESDDHYDIADESATFNKMCDALHAYDASILCGGMTDSWYRSDRMATFYDTCRARIGFISWHQYVTNSSDGKTAQQVIDAGLTLQTHAQEMRQHASDHGISSSVPMFLGEYNVDGTNYTNPWNGNVVGSVYAATTLTGAIAANVNLTMAAWWETVNDSTYGVFGQGPNYSIQSPGVTLNWLGQYAPGQRVTLSIPATLPGVVGFATKSGTRLSVILVNKDLATTVHAHVRVSGFSASAYTARVVSPQNPLGATSTHGVADLNDVELPAGSVTILSTP